MTVTTTAAGARRGSRWWRSRPAVFATLAALVSGLALVTTPATASAQVNWVPCPTSHNESAGEIHNLRLFRHLTLVSAVPTFDKADGRFVDNPLDIPAQATFTSQQSHTFTIQVSSQVSTQPTLLDFFNVQVSTTITNSRTTATGVNAQVVVPPHTRIIGDYGVAAYDITYDVEFWAQHKQTGRCLRDAQTVRETRNAPTNDEGWRLSQVTLP
jgi:hypothetical protein